MKHWIRSCALALSLSGMAAAQAAPQLPSARELDSLPLNVTSATALQKSLAQPVDSKFASLRYGVAVPLSLTLANGVWDIPAAGQSRWRTRVFSAGAQSLSLAFSRFQLPEGAALWIYDAQGQLVQGPYTAAMASADGQLWTAMVLADTAVIEVQVPTHQKSAVALQVASIDHGTRNISKVGLSGNDAGICNIDVVCAQGDNHRNEIRSVAAYTVRVGASSVICTGQLINNMRQDSTPYFLTANHCGLANDNAVSMVLYWNHQRSSCGTGAGSLTQNQTGATFLASEAKSDFALVRLNQPPSSGFNVHYVGLDISDAAPQSGVAIHHPQGDVKKISLYGAGTFAQDNSCAGTDVRGNCIFRVDAWQVRWAQGTTEGGSSGGGLLNQNKRLIGVLSGGSASCETPTEPDFFGRLAKAWQAGCASNTQMKAWIDPDNSGRTEVCGQNPGTSCNSSTRSSGSTTPGTVSATGACAVSTSNATLSNGSGALDLWLLSGLLLPLLARHRKARVV